MGLKEKIGDKFKNLGVNFITKHPEQAINYIAGHPKQVKKILRKQIINNFAGKAISDMIDYIPEDKKENFSLAMKKDIENIGGSLTDTLVGLIADKNIASSYKQGMKNFITNTLMSDKRRKLKEILGYNPPVYFLLTPTKRCTIGCKDCYAGQEKATMSFDQMDLIVGSANKHLNHYFVVVSGGETIDDVKVEADNTTMIKNMFKLYKKYKNIVFMNYTSGKKVNEDVIKEQAKLGNIIFAYSIEGNKKHTDARRGEGTYDHLMKLFELSNKHGVPFGISVTPTRKNIEELDRNFFREMKSKGARFSWVFSYAPIDRVANLDAVPTHDQKKWAYWEYRKTRATVHDLFLASFWEDGPQIQGCMTDVYFHVSCVYENRRTIVVLEPCGFLPYSSTRDLEQRLRNGEKFYTILHSDPQKCKLKEYRAKSKQNPIELFGPDCFFRANPKAYAKIVKESGIEVSRPYDLPLFSDEKILNKAQEYADGWRKVIKEEIFPLYLDNKLPY